MCKNTSLYPGATLISYSDLCLPSSVSNFQVGDLLFCYTTNTIMFFEITSLGSSVGIKNLGYITHPTVTTE